MTEGEIDRKVPKRNVLILFKKNTKKMNLTTRKDR